jgi:hypothetical protein
MTRAAIAALAATIATSCAFAQAPSPASASFADRWRDLRASVVDPSDGQLDVGPVLEKARGFLPIPVIVTEPAVGYGGGLVALFVQPRHEAGGEGFARPDLSAVGAVFTENGTRVALAADSRLWIDGRLKTTLAALGGYVNLDVYGLGATGGEQDEAVSYTLAMNGAFAQVDWQVAPRSPWWLGLRLVYARIEPRLREDPRFPGLQDRVSSTLAGPGVQLIYDSRDNVLTPTRGLYSETSVIAFDEAFGGSVDFQRYEQLLMGWWPVARDVTLGARADYQQAAGETPFYARPFILMRGIPAMRYPGERVGTVEAELRWQFHGRWSVVAFGGVGAARITEGPAPRTRNAGAGGFGFRYEIARKFGMHVGVDVARGPEDTAIYLQVGNAWFRP